MQSNDIVGLSTILTKSRPHWSLFPLVFVGVIVHSDDLNLLQENYLTSTKRSQAEEQDSCQARREAGEDV